MIKTILLFFHQKNAFEEYRGELYLFFHNMKQP